MTVDNLGKAAKVFADGESIAKGTVAVWTPQ